MTSKSNKQGLRALGLACAMAASVSAHAAQSGDGLRVVSSRIIETGAGARVEARVSRTLHDTVLAPRELRIALIGADGSVRAEQRRWMGPAQLPRHSARDAYVSVALDAAPGPQDRLEVEWLARNR